MKTIESLRCLMALALFCSVPTVVGQAPALIAGETFGLSITGGTGPFASSGYYLFIPASTGQSYQVIGVDNVKDSNGSYSYSAAGASGTLHLADADYGSIAGRFTFDTATSGNYQLAAASYSQGGQFEMYSASVPGSIAGKSFLCAVADGFVPFASTGTFTFTVASSGNSYTITGDGVSTVNSSGTCSYSVLNTTTGQILLNDSTAGACTIYVGMSGATTGGYAMTRTGMGFQVGHFTVASALGNPSVTIASPTTAATYSTSSTSINLAGTASGTASITKVTWSNSLGGSGTASGTTSWSVNGIALQPGNDVITVTVNDSTGQNAKATLTVVVAPMITSQLTQNILRLSWPTSCLGWVLEAQTNALNVGVGGSWYPVSGSTNGTQYAVTNQPSPSVFYRLRFP